MLKEKNKKKLFIIAFCLLGFLAMQIKFTKIIGSDVNFSLFDFYGPIVSAFIGSIWGMIAVMAMQLINWAWHGFAVDAGAIIRFFPMLLAVLYFAKKSKLILAVPIIAMIAFWIHPQGRGAWYYALYWLIPLVMYFWRDKTVLARALGATFTAHCVGSVLWLWIFNLKTAVWISLIPVVWKERGLMAVGITLTFIAFNYLLSLVDRKISLANIIKLNPKYSAKKV
ncbi:MAG: hypothetical protein COU31_01625 [Candidatus Magasanikbacteria bacterium CG10_big_fil_rev_8_21_14_0_10_40_10]|uniref:Uncharacterized protein n=1 Tax=Candidatus Magasanikbacteria bacterium CG10_big_fil_rev_8_21_14_0_10_40_10 TaxID=1974648 RepID=A0A2M6W4I6_9BACT|nr:MAG: hypothetical protein COU31_01625 [Candidatus Magasanikbacteria bacterium CG10_big_fil_rev_8_21_14_0_10_40_10]